jgi:hypothetical protein
VRCATFQA